MNHQGAAVLNYFPWYLCQLYFYWICLLCRTKSFKTIEASLRVDALASAGFKISRSKLVDMIRLVISDLTWVISHLSIICNLLIAYNTLMNIAKFYAEIECLWIWLALTTPVAWLTIPFSSNVANMQKCTHVLATKTSWTLTAILAY